MQLAVFGRGELLAAGFAEGEFALEDLAVADEFLSGGVGHDRAERRHLVADRAVADAPARAAFAVLLPPGGEGLPAVFPELRDLDGADIGIELGLDVRVHHAPAVKADLAGLGTLLLEGGELLGHLAESFVENRNLVSDAEAHVGILIERLIARLVDVRGLEGEGFVSIFLGQLDPAIPIPVLHVCATENHKAGFQFMWIDEFGHRKSAFCPDSVQEKYASG